MKSWKKRVSSCFKVPEDSEVKTSSPLIGVVDYLAFTPRSLANAESLMLHLQTRLEGHDARLQYFPLGRTASMEDIAAVYSSIDILVQVGMHAANCRSINVLGQVGMHAADYSSIDILVQVGVQDL